MEEGDSPATRAWCHLFTFIMQQHLVRTFIETNQDKQQHLALRTELTTTNGSVFLSHERVSLCCWIESPSILCLQLLRQEQSLSIHYQASKQRKAS